MTENSLETRVLDAVVTLVDSLLDDFDVVELLTQLTERYAELLDVAAAGLLLAGPLQKLQLLAATSGKVRDLELFQLQADEGPCLDCYSSGRPVSVADLGDAAQRWPRFVPAAMEAGFASVHAVPMRAAGTILGVVGLFGAHPGELEKSDLLVGQSLAHIACVAILQEHAPKASALVPRLRNALAARLVVEQAKGFLRESLDVPATEAFTLLRRYARTCDDHLTDVSRRLITEPEARPEILAAMTTMKAAPPA